MVVDDSLSEGTKETEEKEFTWETVEIQETEEYNPILNPYEKFKRNSNPANF